MPISSSELSPLLSKEKIEARIKAMAQDIDQDCKGTSIHIIALLKGSICLVADLIRKLKTPFLLDFIECSSYGMGGDRPTEVSLSGIEDLQIQKGEDILLIDDIFDRGLTLTKVKGALVQKGASKVKTLVLLRKKKGESSFEIDYVGFDVEDQFVVGYGLDYKEEYRGLEGVFTLL